MADKNRAEHTPHEAQAQERRRDELTVRRYSAAGLTADEQAELTRIYERLAEDRARG